MQSISRLSFLRTFCKAFYAYINLYCLLFHAQRCYGLVVGTVANKIQEILHSKEDYHKDGIKLEK